MAAISGKTLEELDQLSPEQQQQLKTTASLFPDVLTDSELGEIPEGWKINPLSKMVELIGGGTPKKSENDYWGGEIPWFSVKDSPIEGDVFVIDTELKITDLGLRKSSTKLLPEGVTIISARGTVGRLALVGIPTAMNQSCYGVKGSNGIGVYLNYFNLKEGVSILQQNSHGAVFDTITRNTFETVVIAESAIGLKYEFEKNVSGVFDKIKNNLFENKSLEGVRDALIPKLLAGDLKVDEVI
jgi:type I restriction enzyme S subunit